MAISCLGFNTVALFSSQIFKIDDAPVNASLIFWFLLRRWFFQSLETLPWEITKIFYWRANILNQSERSVRQRTDRLKKASRPCRRFFELLPLQSPRGFSALARLYYLARLTKTAMLRRLNVCLHSRLFRFALIGGNLTAQSTGMSQWNWRWISISRDIVASSPSFSRPAARAPRRELARRLRRPGHKSEFWFLVCLRCPLASKHLDNIPLLGIPKGRRSWGARVAQWWERSPPTRVQLPASTPYLGWVCCWFSPLLRKVFLRVLRFSPLLKNQHFKIPIRSGTHEDVVRRG